MGNISLSTEAYGSRCKIHFAAISSVTDALWFLAEHEPKGNPYDNAIMESFYRTLKKELVQDAGYDNPEQARQEIFQYIELYYNTKRIHSALGWLSPTQFEAQNT